MTFFPLESQVNYLHLNYFIYSKKYFPRKLAKIESQMRAMIFRISSLKRHIPQTIAFPLSWGVPL